MNEAETVATIFVLDGNAAARERMAQCLQTGNHRVETFASPGELEQAFGVLKPDLIVLEAQLRDTDGFQWVRSIKEKCCVPVIFVTSRSSPAERIRGFEAGADDYVVKPFSPRELAVRAEAILRRYQH